MIMMLDISLALIALAIVVASALAPRLRALASRVLPSDREAGERMAREAGYAAVESFLDDNPDLPCPWCDGEGYHEEGCELVARAMEEYAGRRPRWRWNCKRWEQ